VPFLRSPLLFAVWMNYPITTLTHPLLSVRTSVSEDNGVARVPCALEQEIFLRPQSKKTIELEVKNRRKNAEEAKTEHLLQLFCYFFRVKNAFSARSELDKVI